MDTQDFGELPVLRTHLEALAEQEPPASAVDVAAARQAADRIRRRHVTRRLGAVAIVAAAGVLSSTALLSAAHKSGGAPTVAPAPAPLDMQKRSYPLAAGTDPIWISGSFGWLPPGFTMLPLNDVEPGQFGITAEGAPTVLNADVTHQPYAAFQIDKYNDPGSQIRQIQQTTTETVQGLPATLNLGVSPEAACVTSKVIEPPDDQRPKDPVGEVIWKLDDGRQAVLQACLPLGISQPDARAMLLHIAQTITVTEKPVAMPFYLKIGNIPSSMRLLSWTGAPGRLNGDNWFFSMMFGPSAMDPGFSLVVTPVDSPNATAQPHMPSCKVVGRLQVCVSSGNLGKPLSAALAGLGYKGLLDDIVVLGADPATWTTDVFR